MTKERAKPLPCPFCRETVSDHSDDAFWFNGEGPPPCYAVRCDNCGAQGPYGYGRERGDHWGAKDDAAKRWNALVRSANETEAINSARSCLWWMWYDIVRDEPSKGADEIERLRDALVAIRGLSRDSTQVGTQAIHEIAVNATISADEPSE